MNITVYVCLEVGHAPAPVDQEQTDAQDDFKDCPRQVAPETHVARTKHDHSSDKSTSPKPKGLHDLVKILHVFSAHILDILPLQRVLDQQLVKEFYLVPCSERSEEGHLRIILP